MKTPAVILSKRLVCLAGLLTLAGLVSGCQTTFRTVDARFMAQPAGHQYVQILPVWFEGAGNLDATLTTNELQALCRQAGEEISGRVQQTLLAKGYQSVGTVRILTGDENGSGLDSETRRQLAAVRIDFCEHLVRSYAVVDNKPLTFQTNSTLGFFRWMSTCNHAALEPNPFHYQMTPALTNLAARLGATNAEAFLLVDTKAFFESPHNRTKRAAWNWSGGGLFVVTEVGVNLAIIGAAVLAGANSAPVPVWVDPFWHSSNSLQHDIALVDVRTREVLWLNRQNFKRQDPRDAEVLTESLAATLRDLPASANR